MNWINDPKYSHYWKTLEKFSQRDPKTDEFLANYNKIFEASKRAHLDTIRSLQNIELSFVPPSLSRPQTQDTGFEFEIDPNLIKFYEESIKFKRERQKKLKKSKQAEGKGHVSGEQVNLQSQTSTSSAPLERAGVKREEELQVLYGDKSKQIHLLETNMQMLHDKNNDLYQPKYWPSFPLRINFG